ncbi:hypothetical protein H312_03255 [Anncaliia algerae PRA339]|uniref:Uncharacterized protein n=1 Tax=Anncaliia algerae PRA339 TaxID=1288291 RepID=A0A059EXA2_9MICR|nr:hypothetical protein H312_03255 [Anncaliia algerae PRA339]
MKNINVGQKHLIALILISSSALHDFILQICITVLDYNLSMIYSSGRNLDYSAILLCLGHYSIYNILPGVYIYSMKKGIFIDWSITISLMCISGDVLIKPIRISMC